MKQRLIKVIRNALILLGIGALYALFFHLTGIGIPCIFNRITGLRCPGCGVTRMCLSLLRLDFKGAFGFNQAVFCLSPIIAFIIGRLIYLYIRYGKKQDRLTNILSYCCIAVLTVFGIARNIFKF